MACRCSTALRVALFARAAGRLWQTENSHADRPRSKSWQRLIL